MNERSILITFHIEQRREQIGRWMLDHRDDSIRKIAKEFMLSKSQCHRDIHNLRCQDDELYIQCINVLRRRKHG